MAPTMTDAAGPALTVVNQSSAVTIPVLHIGSSNAPPQVSSSTATTTTTTTTNALPAMLAVAHAAVGTTPLARSLSQTLPCSGPNDGCISKENGKPTPTAVVALDSYLSDMPSTTITTVTTTIGTTTTTTTDSLSDAHHQTSAHINESDNTISSLSKTESSSLSGSFAYLPASTITPTLTTGTFVYTTTAARSVACAANPGSPYSPESVQTAAHQEVALGKSSTVCSTDYSMNGSTDYSMNGSNSDCHSNPTQPTPHTMASLSFDSIESLNTFQEQSVTQSAKQESAQSISTKALAAAAALLQTPALSPSIKSASLLCLNHTSSNESDAIHDRDCALGVDSINHRQDPTVCGSPSQYKSNLISQPVLLEQEVESLDKSSVQASQQPLTNGQCGPYIGSVDQPHSPSLLEQAHRSISSTPSLSEGHVVHCAESPKDHSSLALQLDALSDKTAHHPDSLDGNAVSTSPLVLSKHSDEEHSGVRLAKQASHSDSIAENGITSNTTNPLDLLDDTTVSVETLTEMKADEKSICLSGEALPGQKELDEAEAKRKEAHVFLSHIEAYFARIQQLWYSGKSIAINQEAESIRDGTHPNLNGLLDDIEQKYADRKRVLSGFQQHLACRNEITYNAAVHQANSDFLTKKLRLRRRMLDQVRKKRWQLEYERQKTDENSSENMILDPKAMAKRRRLTKVEVNEWKSILSGGAMFPSCSINGITSSELAQDIKALGAARSQEVAEEFCSGSGRYARRPFSSAFASDSILQTFESTEAGVAPTCPVVPLLNKPLAKERLQIPHEVHRRLSKPSPQQHSGPLQRLNPANRSDTAPCPISHPLLQSQTHAQIQNKAPLPSPSPPPIQQPCSELCASNPISAPSAAAAIGVHPLPPILPPIDVVSSGSQLRLRGHWFKVDDRADLFDNGTKFTIKIITIGGTDLIVQRTDGSKTKLPLAFLIDGRVELKPKP
ncbi:hypothetical protein BASA62_009953 [Batrachochytrium salamandrivorans]|nr:hypothetical protein BASA62_009953 [Batrachochytrium salamandrivorans]